MEWNCLRTDFHFPQITFTPARVSFQLLCRTLSRLREKKKPRKHSLFFPLQFYDEDKKKQKKKKETRNHSTRIFKGTKIDFIISSPRFSLKIFQYFIRTINNDRSRIQMRYYTCIQFDSKGGCEQIIWDYFNWITKYPLDANTHFFLSVIPVFDDNVSSKCSFVLIIIKLINYVILQRGWTKSIIIIRGNKISIRISRFNYQVCLGRFEYSLEILVFFFSHSQPWNLQHLIYQSPINGGTKVLRKITIQTKTFSHRFFDSKESKETRSIFSLEKP